jgi:transcriptional regulator with XRE-family HTH domain
MEFIPDRLRTARQNAGLTQAAVAAAADVSVFTVRRAELGLHDPSASALGRMAAAIGVQIDDLFSHGPEADMPSTARGTKPPHTDRVATISGVGPHEGA